MSSATVAPIATFRPVIEAVFEELRRRQPTGVLPNVVTENDDVLVIGEMPAPTPGTMVAAGIDDDGNPEPVLRYAAAQAQRLRLPLRTVHVWSTGRQRVTPLRRMRHSGEISDADLLLSEVLFDCLPPAAAQAAERQILHDADPVPALCALSASAALLVVGVCGDETHDDAIGTTVRGLLGRTACPLVLIPAPCPTDRHD